MREQSVIVFFVRCLTARFRSPKEVTTTFHHSQNLPEQTDWVCFIAGSNPNLHQAQTMSEQAKTEILAL